jgi:hypothetical protein
MGMKFNPNLQKRFWIGTVWLGHANPKLAQKDNVTEEQILSEYRMWWARLAENINVQWAQAQIEVGNEGGLHIQVACKTTDSKRWKWMPKNLPASWQPADNWPAVLNYCTKTSDRIEYLGTIGKRPKSKMGDGHGSAKQRCIAYLKEGRSPEWVALNDPDAYFTHHRSIRALYEAVLIAKRRGEMEEEE